MFEVKFTDRVLSSTKADEAIKIRYPIKSADAIIVDAEFAEVDEMSKAIQTLHTIARDIQILQVHQVSPGRQADKLIRSCVEFANEHRYAIKLCQRVR